MTSPAAFLLDAQVLFDYAVTNIEVPASFSRHVAPIHAVERSLLQVFPNEPERASAIGIDLVEPSLELLLDASVGGEGLGFDDWVHVLLAEQNGWVLVSNEKPLRAACAVRGISVEWGLHLMLPLVRDRIMGPKDAVSVAEALHRANPGYVTPRILKSFAKKCRRV